MRAEEYSKLKEGDFRKIAQDPRVAKFMSQIEGTTDFAFLTLMGHSGSAYKLLLVAFKAGLEADKPKNEKKKILERIFKW